MYDCVLFSKDHLWLKNLYGLRKMWLVLPLLKLGWRKKKSLMAAIKSSILWCLLQELICTKTVASQFLLWLLFPCKWSASQSRYFFLKTSDFGAKLQFCSAWSVKKGDSLQFFPQITKYQLIKLMAFSYNNGRSTTTSFFIEAKLYWLQFNFWPFSILYSSSIVTSEKLDWRSGHWQFSTYRHGLFSSFQLKPKKNSRENEREIKVVQL